jgi:small-conductance mechanosensitive channel
MQTVTHKRRIGYLAALLSICLFLLAAGRAPVDSLLGMQFVSVARAQEEDPTSDEASTPDPESTPDAEGQSAVQDGVEGAVSDLQEWTRNDVARLLLSFILIALATVYGARLIQVVLRRLTRRTATTFDDALLEALKPQIRWLIAAIGFQIATFRLEFISGFWESLLQTTYFLLYWFVGMATAWRTLDYSVKWYSESLGPDIDPNVRDQLLPLALRLGHIGLAILGLGIVLAHFGVDLLAITAALGLGGFALSLAAKETITNVISGIVIMFDSPFRVGDRIEVPNLGTWADVVDIGIRSTRVVTRDNRLVVIPNATVVDAEVVNYSQPDPTYRLQVDLGIGYGVSIPWVKGILEETVRGVNGVLEDKPVNVLFTGFGDSAMDFRVRWWVSSPGEKRAVTDAVCAAIQEVAEEKGIDMPNPTYAVENTVKFGTEDAARIIQALGESPDAVTVKPVDDEDRDVGRNG